MRRVQDKVFPVWTNEFDCMQSVCASEVTERPDAWCSNKSRLRVTLSLRGGTTKQSRAESYGTLRNRELRSPLGQHYLMDRFVVPPRDDSPMGCTRNLPPLHPWFLQRTNASDCFGNCIGSIEHSCHVSLQRSPAPYRRRRRDHLPHCNYSVRSWISVSIYAIDGRRVDCNAVPSTSGSGEKAGITHHPSGQKA